VPSKGLGASVNIPIKAPVPSKDNELLALLSVAPWDVVYAVINALQGPKQRFKRLRDPASGVAGNGVRIVEPGGLVAVATSQEATPQWNPKWVAQLSDAQRIRILQVLLADQLSETNSLLNAWALVDASLGQPSVEMAKDGLSARVFSPQGQALGLIVPKGFTPEKGFAKAWAQAQRLAQGDWSVIANLPDLSKPALRTLFNLSLASSSGPGSVSALGGSSAQDHAATAAKALSKRFSQSVIDRIERDFIPDFGGQYIGKNWTLEQASPSQIGTKDLEWFGTVNAGRVAAMAVDPDNPDSIIVSLLNAGLWHSSDSGENWLQVSDQDLGAALPPEHFTTLKGLRSLTGGSSLMLAFSGTDEEGRAVGSAGGTNTLYSINSGATWNLATAITDDVVVDVLQVGNSVVIATAKGLRVYDVSGGWESLLAGDNPLSYSGARYQYKQLKSIPGDEQRLLGLKTDNQIVLIELATGRISNIGLPVQSNSINYSRIETADLGAGLFRLYFLPSPHQGFPVETDQPGLATLYSLDLSTDFSGSTITDVSTEPVASSDPSRTWLAWGYNIPPLPDPFDLSTAISTFRSSLWDAMGNGTQIEGGQQWFHTLELMVDPLFPEKVYVGGTTLGYVLHPSVPVRSSQRERGVNLHWDPAGFNSYVQTPKSGGGFGPGSGPVPGGALYALSIINSIGGSRDLQEFLDDVISFQDKPHADAQLLFTDGTRIYYGNDGGLNRFIVDPEATTRSVVLSELGMDYSWGQFKQDVRNGNVKSSPLGAVSLVSLPALGFYKPNWEGLNRDLISNLYQGGSLNVSGSNWITGAQDNGISVGSSQNVTPYLVSNGDGGNGFFGDTDFELAWTHQWSSANVPIRIDNPSPAIWDQGRVQLWQVNPGSSSSGKINPRLSSALRGISLLAQNSKGKGDLLDQVSGSGDFSLAKQFQRKVSGRRSPVSTLNLLWYQDRDPWNNETETDTFEALWLGQLDEAPESMNTIDVIIPDITDITEAIFADFINANGGRLFLELQRADGSSEYVSLSITSSKQLVMDTFSAKQPRLTISKDGGDTSMVFDSPVYSDNADFYFPAEQHPSIRSMIGIADASRIYVYPDVFASSPVLRTDYRRTVDLRQLYRSNFQQDPGNITAFAFAPWDTTGSAMLVGFDNGQAMLVIGSLEDTPATAQGVELVSFNDWAGSVTALAFSHPRLADYTSGEGGHAFVAVAHKDRLYPELTRWVRTNPTADPNFNRDSVPEGRLNDVIVKNQNTIYTATDDGVYATDFNASNSAANQNWLKIGGTYADSLPTTRISNLASNPDSDRLWAFTYGRGVYSYDTTIELQTDLETELININIPPDWEGHQFVNPLDLVSLVLGIDDPRILNVEFALNQRGLPMVVSPTLPENVSLLADPSARSSMGDWFNPQAAAFLDHDALTSSMQMYAECSLIVEGSVIASFDLGVVLDQIDSKTALFKAATLDFTKPYNAALELMQVKDVSPTDMAAVVNISFSSPLLSAGKKRGAIPLATKVISFSSSSSDAVGLELSPVLSFDAKANSLDVYAQQWLNLDRATELTPLVVDRSLVGVPSQVLLPALSETGEDPGVITAALYAVRKDGKVAAKPLLELVEHDGQGMWWVPSKEGRYFIEIRGSEAGSLFSYDLVVEALPEVDAAVAFPTRMKTFEAGVVDGLADFVHPVFARPNPLAFALSQAGLDGYPWRFKKNNFNPDFQAALAADSLAPLATPQQFKDQLDGLARSGDFLLDFGVLPKIHRDPQLSEAFYEAVDWDQVDFTQLSATQRRQVRWNRVDELEASRAPSFSTTSGPWQHVGLAGGDAALLTSRYDHNGGLS